MGLGALAGIGFGLSAIGSIFKGVLGNNQRKEAKEGLANLERPEYEIPNEVYQYLGQTQADTRRNMPGYETARQGIDQSQANASGLAVQSGNPLLGIGGIQGQTNKANRNLAVENASYIDNKKDARNRALLLAANYKEREQQMNEFAPYRDKYNEFREQLGAGQQNINSGLGDMSSALISLGQFV
jgi:hypothetical protein